MSATVTDIATMRARNDFVRGLLDAAKKANALQWARWEAIANKQEKRK